MSEERTRIFQKNLLNFLHEKGKTQKDLADALGLSPQVVNTWCVGVALPRMGKLQMLAEYFGVQISDLLESPKEKPPTCDMILECHNLEIRQLAGRIARLDKDDRAVVSMMVDSLSRSEKYMRKNESAG